MALNITKKGNHCSVAVEGELTIYQVSGYHKDFLNKCSSAETIAIDLSNVEELDAAGVQLLLSLEKQQHNKGGSLSLAGQNQQIVETMEVLNLSAHFKCHGD